MKLASHLRARRLPVTQKGLEEYGYEIGRGLAPGRRTAGPAAALADALAAMGFQLVTRAEGEVTTFELRNCPYRDQRVRESDPKGRQRSPRPVTSTRHPARSGSFAMKSSSCAFGATRCSRPREIPACSAQT